MEFRVLGPLEVVHAGRVVQLPRPKSRALLAFLLLHANEVVSTERIVDELWGDNPPKTAVASLQNEVSRLRKALGPDRLRSRPPGYELRIDPDQLDLIRFQRLVAEAKAAQPATRAEKLREALSMWRGAPLADLVLEPFAQAEVARLEELHLSALEERIDADLAVGAGGDLVGELEALVARHPLREPLRAQLMLALYRAGRQADALDAYRDARRVLTEELGLEPSGELQRLERAILVHDASLAAPPRAPSDPAPSPGRAPAPTTRKVVTVLFADVLGSTALGDSLDPEAVRDVMSRYFREMAAAVGRHGGTVEKFVGDAVMAVFGVPAVHEDDALRAARAAADMRAALTRMNEALERERGLRLEMRVALNTGEVVVGDPEGQTLVTGDVVNVCKRLEEAAEPGDILVGARTLALVREAVAAEPIEPIAVRGKTEPIPAFRLLDVLERAPDPARDLDAPVVGREAELAQLRGAFDLARADRGCRVAVLVGDPGIGKTRLAAELGASLRQEATVLAGRCASYGEGATYLPLRDVVAQAVGGEASEASIQALVEREDDGELIARRVAQVVGATAGAASSGDAFWAFRRLFEALAAPRPLVVVLEDVHWAEPTLLDLVEYLREWTADASILVICTARPELVAERPAWMSWAIVLDRLTERESHALVEGASRAARVPAETRARIVDVAEGNPLFVEQLLAHAAEGGSLADVPPSLEALLASRLDRLDPGERALLGRAAVVGRDFWRGAVLELTPPAEADAVDRGLMSLARKNLIRAGRSSLPREDAFTFRHVLIRDVAHSALPKAARADLHERCADWLDRRMDGADEIVGYHLEQAFRYRSELGPLDRAGRQLAVEARARLGGAGVRAFMRGDIPAALNLLHRATTLLPEDDSYRLELLCELGVVLRAAGDLPRALATLRDAERAAAAAGVRRVELRARLELDYLRLFSDPDLVAAELLELTERLTPTLEAFGDHRALGRAWIIAGFVQGAFFCRNAAWADAAERALVHYRLAQWPPATCFAHLAPALLFGPTPVDEAIARCESLLDEADAGRAAAADVRAYMGGLEACRGRFDDARRLVASAEATYAELGQTLSIATVSDVVKGNVELMAGDATAAEAAFRRSCETCERLNEWAQLSTRAAELGDALVELGRLEEADACTQTAQRHAEANDVGAQFSWRSVRAKVYARQGIHDEAIVLVQEAAEIAGATDALNQRGKVLLDRAQVLRLANRVDDAAESIEEARRLFARKRNVVGVRAAEALARAPAAV